MIIYATNIFEYHCQIKHKSIELIALQSIYKNRAVCTFSVKGACEANAFGQGGDSEFSCSLEEGVAVGE